MGNKLKFAERLKVLLRESNMNQRTLADELGITAGAVGQWCAGMTMPTSARIGRISDIFGCNKDWLMGEDVPRDRDVQKNASGYTDPTAFKAIKTMEKDGLSSMTELKKGGIYEYTLQSGFVRNALVVSDERRNDQKSVAIIMLTEQEHGIEIMCNGKRYANPDRLSYGYVDNFGEIVGSATDDEMKAVDNAVAIAVGLDMGVVGCVDMVQAEKIKQMIKALKVENEDKQKCIESLQSQIRTLSAECNVLSAEASRLRDTSSDRKDYDVIRMEIEAKFYKEQYEKLLERMIDL